VARIRWANAEDPKGNTLKMDLDSGYDRYIGRVGNHYMYVVAMGVDEVYPVSARWMADAEWRAYQ